MTSEKKEKPERKYLFVCAVGKSRSPTAASVAKEIANKRGLPISMFSGGIMHIEDNDELRRNLHREICPESEDLPTTQQVRDHLVKHLSQYEKIFVMEPYIESAIRKIGYKGPIFCLNIKDVYRRDDPDLREILKNKLERLID